MLSFPEITYLKQYPPLWSFPAASPESDHEMTLTAVAFGDGIGRGFRQWLSLTVFH